VSAVADHRAIPDPPPGVPGNRRATFLVIGRVRHKACYGRLHPEGKWIPVTDFHQRRWANGNRGPRPNCKACDSATSGVEQQIPFRRIGWMVDELVARLGQAEAARRIGVGHTTMWGWIHHPPPAVRRRTARKIVVALHAVRQRGEVRHRLSIHHGASMRGKTEREVRSRKDLYKPHGDADNQASRRRWANLPQERREIVLAYDRERRRKERST